MSILICVYPVDAAAGSKLKTVSVAYFYDRNYFGGVYDSPQKEGFGYNYLQAIGNYSGWEYKYVYGDYSTLLEQFMLGKIDIMPALPRDFDQKNFYDDLIENAKNDEAKRSIEKNKIEVLYPNQPMNSVEYYFCVPGDTDSDSISISNYVRKKIGVPSAIWEYADEWMNKLGLGTDLMEYENEAACINALNKGEVAAVIARNSVAESGLLVSRKVGSIDYYLCVSSNSRGLLRDINNALDNINSTTGGYLSSLQSTYASNGNLETILSAPEKEWIRDHKKIRLGTLSDFKPFCSINSETGETDGFIYDAAPSIFSNIESFPEVEYVHYDNYIRLLEALDNEEIDIAFPVTTYLYQSEMYNYIPTESIVDNNLMVVYKGEFSEGTFASIAYTENGIVKFYDDINYGTSSLYEYASDKDCIDAVINDEVTCAIVRDNTTESYIRNTGLNRKVHVIPAPEKLKMGIGVKRGNIVLYTLMTRAVNHTLEGHDLTDISLDHASHIEERTKSDYRGFFRPEVIILLIVSVILGIIVAFLAATSGRILNANRELKKANNEIKGVAELQQQNFDIIGILTRDYSSVFKINLDTEDIQIFRMASDIDTKYTAMLSNGARFSEFFNQYVRDYVFEDDKPKMYDEILINIIRKKLKQRTSYAIRFRKLMSGSAPRYYEYRVSTVDVDITGKIMSVIIAFVDCNDEILHELEYMKGLEKTLKSDAVITGLTGDFDWVAYVTNTESKDPNETGVTHYRVGDIFRQRFNDWENEHNFTRMMQLMAENIVVPEDRKEFLHLMTKNHIRKHLMKDVAYFINFRVDNGGTLEYYQIKCVADYADGRLFGFILGFHNVDEELRKEKEEQEKLEQMVADRTAELKEKNESLNRMNNDIIELMGNVVEGRDEESGQHVRRVQDFTNVLANQVMEDYPEFGLTPELVAVITSASALHDVGKIMIPDSILLKPGRLTNEEYEIMKTHTISGTEILKKMPADWDKTYMQISMEICRHHHEKYDGRGYPDELKGDSIPISAQIVSVADCYDALVSKRVYKDAFSCDEAYNMIQNGECGAFSPRVMKSFSHCRKEFEKLVDKSNPV